MATSPRAAVRLVAILGCAVSLATTTAKADTARFTGGPQGMVKSAKGELLEGIMVQLIARKNAVRTTVYSNADGRYAFPALEAGTYPLRIARPREFHPFVIEGIDIKGATPLADIVLDYVTDQDTLPPLPEIMAQMTGSEWLLSLSGTGAEKKLLTNNCNWCHSYQQIFRNRYDEEGWRKIVYRMIHGAGSPLININEGVLPGTHWIYADKNDIIWGSENWAHSIWRLDPKTEEFTRIPWKVREPPNTPMGGNYAIDPEGFIWKARERKVTKVAALTGDPVTSYVLKKFAGTYGSAMSRDGRYFGGGAWPRDGVVVVDTQTAEAFEPDTSPRSGPARGEFDLHNNYWAGGRGGQLVKFDTKEKRIHEYPLPTPYASMYSAQTDNNGEVSAGLMNSGLYLRFDSKTFIIA